jgi:autotransporter-associated beta strand protein
VNIGNASSPGASLTSSPLILNGNIEFRNFNLTTTAGPLTWAGNISEIGGARNLVKNDAVIVNLDGNNSYTGTTQVNQGTLRVNGTHTGAGTYSVSGGATLGGSGTILGHVDSQNTSILAPGNSVGSLTASTVRLDNVALQFEIDSVSSDRLNVINSNGLTFGGTSTFTMSNGGGAVPGFYRLIDYDGNALPDLSNFALGTTTLGTFGLSLLNNQVNRSVDLLVQGTGVISFWNIQPDGAWSPGGNWTAGSPNAPDAIAIFGPIAVGPRTITVDGARTVGTVTFDNTNAYTIAGSTLTLDAAAAPVGIKVLQGSHTISAPIVLNKDATLNVEDASSNLLLTGNVTATGRNLTKAGAGLAQLENVRASSLNVSAGKARISAKGTPNSASGTSVVNSLTIATGAQLDLTNNSAIVDYTGAVGNLVTTTRQHLQNGRLVSTSATGLIGLGYGDNAVLSPVKTAFAGQSVDPSSLLVKYTYFGDSDLDGDVDVADLGNLATNWQTANVWSGGDFDYNGSVDVNDLGLLATNWQAGTVTPLGPDLATALANVGLASAMVPEPAAIGLLGVIGFAFGRRRRRV